jgi:hypothetical protein
MGAWWHGRVERLAAAGRISNLVVQSWSGKRRVSLWRVSLWRVSLWRVSLWRVSLWRVSLWRVSPAMIRLGSGPDGKMAYREVGRKNQIPNATGIPMSAQTNGLRKSEPNPAPAATPDAPTSAKASASFVSCLAAIANSIAPTQIKLTAMKSRRIEN